MTQLAGIEFSTQLLRYGMIRQKQYCTHHIAQNENDKNAYNILFFFKIMNNNFKHRDV